MRMPAKAPRDFRYGICKTLACALCLLLVNATGAQEQWDFKYLLTPLGVPLTEVRSIAQDRNGRIWVGAWGNGVARLGATEWLAYDEDSGLVGNWVRGLAAGTDNSIWISTADGLCLYRNEQLECFTAAELPALPSNDLDIVYATGGGDIILGTREGHVLLIRGGASEGSAALRNPARWSELGSPENPELTRLASVMDDGRGIVWLSMRGGALFTFDGTRMSPAQGPGIPLILARGSKGVLWGAAWEGTRLLRHSGGAWTEAGNLTERIISLLETNDGFLYAGTSAGLFRFDGGRFQEVDLGDNIGTPYISVLHEAPGGALWVGAQDGLIRGALSSWERFDTTTEGEPIVGLVADPLRKRGLMAIDRNNGVSRLEGLKWRPFIQLDVPERLHSYVSGDAEPYLWALGGNSLFQVSLLDGTIATQTTLPPGPTHQVLFRTQAGETWFLGESGIVALSDGQWVPRPEAPGYVPRRVHTVVEPERDVFYVGLVDGIERWDESGVTAVVGENGVSTEDVVYTSCLARNGDIWFGTFGSGLFQLSGGSLRRYDERDGLAQRSISNILETSDGTIWVSYRRAGVGAFRNGLWQYYANHSGLPNVSVTGMFEDELDRLWLQTLDGPVFRYRPDSTPPDTELVAATLKIPVNGVGVFSFNAKDGWQRTPSHELLHSWRLLDADTGEERKSWSPYSARSTVITSPLPPGRYRIEGRASDEARNVDPEPASVVFEVFPPIWRQSGVLAPSLALVALLLVAVFLRMRAHHALRHSETALSQSNRQLMNEIRERLLAEKRLNEHFEQLESLIAGRTADLEAAQRALVQQERLAMLGKLTASVSHELRNPLGTLRSTLFTIGRRIREHGLDLEELIVRADRSIKRCDRIIEEFLDVTRSVSADRETQAMDHWLEAVLAEMEIPGDVHCVYTFESGIALDVDPERLRRAVVNVVNNALQAMGEVEDGFKRLRIKSRVRDGRYEIVVKDNGPGMSAESLSRIYEPLYSTKGFGVGLGVPIVKDIMEKHEGGVEFHSVLGKGTTVVLWLPLAPDAPDPDGPAAG